MSKIRKEIPGWKYYNHAAIPSTAPHEKINEEPIKNGDIWNIKGGKPLFVRYCTDWDCKEKTEWWYVIKEAPFTIEELTSKKRKHINQSLKKCNVFMINPNDYLEDLYEVYEAAFKGYENADNKKDFKQFRINCLREFEEDVDFWGGFSCEDNKLIGYMTIKKFSDCVESCTAKYHPDYLKYRISDAIHYIVLNEYLNVQNKKYISSGSRNINHITKAQEYKIENFKFRKAYCKLHVIYKPILEIIIKIVYPFRKYIKKIDKSVIIHQIASVLEMEEIKRKYE